MDDDAEIEVCPLCAVWPTGKDHGDVACCNIDCPLHDVPIPLHAWNMLAALAGYTDSLRRAWDGTAPPA